MRTWTLLMLAGCKLFSSESITTPEPSDPETTAPVRPPSDTPRAVSAPPPDLPPSPTRCREDEKVLFECPVVGQRWIAVCGSGDLAEDTGWVEYRFGSPTEAQLVFPSSREGSRSAFTYERYTRPQVTSSKLSFENGGYAYVVQSYASHELDEEMIGAGVTITDPQQKSTEIDCTTITRDRLMDLEYVVHTVE